MSCSHGKRLISVLATLLAAFGLVPGRSAGQAPAPAESTPGQFFTITEPITHETYERVQAATRQLVDQKAGGVQGTRPILVFEFQPGEAAPGKSSFGASYDLATLISRELAGARLTVAYVPKPMSGYSVMPIVACTEIVMGARSTLGPITPEGDSVDQALKGPIQFLAVRKTRDPDLLLGMLDRDADLRLVRTSDKTVHYVLAERMPKFLETHHVVDDEPAWEGGRRGVLSAARAREEGFCKRTAETPAEVAGIYQIGGGAVVDDPTLGRRIQPGWIKLEGPIDALALAYMTRGLEQARQDQVNLLFIEIDSPGGSETAADGLADMIAAAKDVKTVCYVSDRALGLAALIPLACREIVFKKGARIGDVTQSITGRNGEFHELSPALISSLAKKAGLLAREMGRPEAVGVAMVDPGVEILEARDTRTGGSRLLSRTEIDAEPGRYQVTQVRKPAGATLTLSDQEAAAFGLGQVVADVEDLKGLYGLRGQPIRVDGPSWIDSLAALLTDRYVSWLLLFIGVFMLVIEFKLPGIGLPAITSALAFLLFFWSHYLSGTADQLEIILFLIGLVCLGLELFVFPGFGIFGMAGMLLMLTSIVMASHTFTWPTKDYEYREMGHTLLQVTGVLAAVVTGAVAVGRYLPSIPLFNRLVLKPEPWISAESEIEPGRLGSEGYESLAFLIGETGRSTSPLRPTGKARFGSMVIDVTAADSFVEPDSLVEVLDVQGTRVVVKRVV